ncbi:tripartite tricarboxylate transporter substrate binding protein [Comamonas testosteroni]|uniref:Tripartite tricarboxylate transporter substrate binding protein n=1 Tax=Comamonas testosteroni TaxID=285 RepID=A0A373FR25_COMTE|nr:tripartite tricarboxylate transporter substrate binding protein [Comamonas testosteroni]RGE45809.1 tripartite tricarboxylate transporter substrate binding protein [Comamonas testosteroni]
MNLSRLFARTAWALLAATCVQGAAMAQQPDYPARPVKLLVANGAGSVPDLLARQVGVLVSKEWKQPVVVENKGAAGGVSAVDAVVKSQPDGYTLLVGGDSAITIMPNVQRNLPYDVKNDLVPVTKLGQSDFVLVANPKKGYRTLKEFVAFAKAHPGQINYASSGSGGAQHLAMEQFKQRAGFYATHIPYRGGPQGLQDVLGGQVDVMLIAIAPALAQIQSGKLVALAVSGAHRHELLPQVPTVAETYKGFEAGAWFGLFAPKGTPAAVVQAVAQDTDRALKDPELRKSLVQQGITPAGEGQQQFARQIRTDDLRIAKLVKDIGLTVE